MSANIILGSSDRGARGVLRATLCTTPRGAEYVDLRHFALGADGTMDPGNGLAIRLDEIEPTIALLARAKAVLHGTKPQHRTISAAPSRAALDEEIADNDKLFCGRAARSP